MRHSFALPAALVLLFATASASAQTRDGFYVGGMAGWTDADIEANFPSDDAFEENDPDIVLGGLAGYNFPLGDNGVLIGAETSFDWLTDEFDESDFNLDIVGRVGFQVAPNLLAFGRAGYSKLYVDGPNLDGWTVGGGAEIDLGPATALRAEYRYADYEGPDAIIFDGPRPIDLSPTTHRIMGGVVFRF